MTAGLHTRPAPPSPLRLSGAAAHAAARSTVVIVDDEPANVALVERLLETVDVVNVHGFTDPRRALAFCAGSLPDLVLLDLHMPGLDGFAFMEALQELVPEGRFLPVLVLTADVTTEVKERSLAAGAKDFLTKPIDRTEVLLRVSNLLETRALADRLERHNIELKAELDLHVGAEREVAAELERRRERIHGALSPGGFSMVFQPIADLASGRVVGAEALARFAGKPRRSPDEWFAEADSIGRGAELEIAAIAAALDQVDFLPSGTFLAINTSPGMAAAPELEALLADAPAERVVLELTEQSRIGDYDGLVGALDQLRRRSVRIAVDDTGAGYASFQHLLRLRPEILKLDTTLTRGIHADPVRRSLAAALVTFATEIDARIIAEGIEIQDELATLQDVGIPWGQGFHLSPPGALPLSAVTL